MNAITELENAVLQSARALGMLQRQEQERSTRCEQLRSACELARKAVIQAEQDYERAKGDLACARHMSRQLSIEVLSVRQSREEARRALRDLATSADEEAILKAAAVYGAKRRLLAQLDEEARKVSAEIRCLEDQFDCARKALDAANGNNNLSMFDFVAFTSSNPRLDCTEAENALMEAAAALPG